MEQLLAETCRDAKLPVKEWLVLMESCLVEGMTAQSRC